MKEKHAVLSVVIVLIIVPCLVFWYQDVYRPSRHTDKVFVITGVGSRGAWTLERVNGLNYGWKSFTPATIHIQLNDSVVFQFHSADVFHQFYVPGLDIGPVDVVPGYVKEIRFKASKSGVFQYYCTTLCGTCHFYMQGWIIVTPPGKTPVSPPPVTCPLCLPELGGPPQQDPVALGEYLYRAMGCITCHGIDGRGGVNNYNYINKTVPAHNRFSEKIFLTDEEDAEIFLKMIQEGADLNKPAPPPDIVRYPVVKSRLNAALRLIENGKNAARLDMAGPEPPLQMPAWRHKLGRKDINAIMGYFVSLYPWEKEG